MKSRRRGRGGRRNPQTTPAGVRIGRGGITGEREAVGSTAIEMVHPRVVHRSRHSLSDATARQTRHPKSCISIHSRPAIHSRIWGSAVDRITRGLPIYSTIRIHYSTPRALMQCCMMSRRCTPRRASYMESRVRHRRIHLLLLLQDIIIIMVRGGRIHASRSTRTRLCQARFGS